MRATGKPDANTADLVELWRNNGGEAWYMAPGTGYDLIVAFPGGNLAVVEVKDGRKPPSERRLTKNEQAQREKFEARGVPYIVWECDADVLQMVARLREAVAVR